MQSLQSFARTYAAIDCSNNYLVYASYPSYLVVLTYGSSSGSSFGALPTWAVAIIITVGLVFVTGIAIFVFALVKKRRKHNSKSTNK